MSARDVDVDALFERSADARLLERRRNDELGLAPYPPPSSPPPQFGAESIVDDGGTHGRARAAMLRVALEARPARELIPGAVVTVVVSLYDDGDHDADDVRLRIATPGDAEAVADSCVRDGVAIDAEMLLGEGLRVGTVPARSVVRIRLVLRILPGTEPLDVLAHATAPGVAAIAAPALRLHRRAGHAAYEPQRPFFELEAGEIFEEPPAADEVRAVDALVGERVVPQLRVVPPTTEPQPVYVLLRPFDADRVRALERIFGGTLPHGLAAVALLAAIACTDGPLGEALGLGAFARAVSASIPRAVVAARMARSAPAVITAGALQAIRADAFASDADAERTGIAFCARLEPHELAALRTVLARDPADPFLTGAQILLAVVPRSLEGIPAPAARHVADALASYRVAGGAWLTRVTVHRTIDAGYDPLVAGDPAVFDAGRALVATLRGALR